MWRGIGHHPGLRRVSGHSDERTGDAAGGAGHGATAHPATPYSRNRSGGEAMMRPVFAALFAVAFSASSLAQSAPTRADTEKDPVLHAMLSEMDRTRQRLQLQGFDKPYFIEYRIDDIAQYAAAAECGALTDDHETHSRIARVTVRVGDYKSDSSSARGDGSLELTSFENDPMVLRYSLWAATDMAYKAALNAWAQKQAELKAVQTPPQADDFSHEKPTVFLEPVAALDQDRAAWKQAIVEGSGLYASDPTAKTYAGEVEVSRGSVEARVRTAYLVNSEG